MEIPNVHEFQVTKLPNTAYYIPNFITAAEEAMLLEKVYSAPKPKWKQLSNRKLQNWGGLPHPKGMLQEPLPEWLNYCVNKVVDLGVFGKYVPNHVLVNEYLAGQGIMPHEDGPLFHPIITTINLGSHTILDYYAKMKEDQIFNEETENLESRYVGSLLLERCSLLIVKDDLYHKYLHGIQERTDDFINDKIENMSLCSQTEAVLQRDRRISLTIRNVPQTLKAKFLFGLTTK